jgi:hypothetical protein
VNVFVDVLVLLEIFISWMYIIYCFVRVQSIRIRMFVDDKTKVHFGLNYTEEIILLVFPYSARFDGGVDYLVSSIGDLHKCMSTTEPYTQRRKKGRAEEVSTRAPLMSPRLSWDQIIWKPIILFLKLNICVPCLFKMCIY